MFQCLIAPATIYTRIWYQYSTPSLFASKSVRVADKSDTRKWCWIRRRIVSKSIFEFRKGRAIDIGVWATVVRSLTLIKNVSGSVNAVEYSWRQRRRERCAGLHSLEVVAMLSLRPRPAHLLALLDTRDKADEYQGKSFLGVLESKTWEACSIHQRSIRNAAQILELPERLVNSHNKAREKIISVLLKHAYSDFQKYRHLRTGRREAPVVCCILWSPLACGDWWHRRFRDFKSKYTLRKMHLGATIVNFSEKS